MRKGEMLDAGMEEWRWSEDGLDAWVWDGNCEIVPILMDLLAICPVLKLLPGTKFSKN